MGPGEAETLLKQSPSTLFHIAATPGTGRGVKQARDLRLGPYGSGHPPPLPAVLPCAAPGLPGCAGGQASRLGTSAVAWGLTSTSGQDAASWTHRARREDESQDPARKKKSRDFGRQRQPQLPLQRLDPLDTVYKEQCISFGVSPWAVCLKYGSSGKSGCWAAVLASQGLQCLPYPRLKVVL